MAEQMKRYKRGKEVTRGSVMGPSDTIENLGKRGNYDFSETMRMRAPDFRNRPNTGSFRSPVGMTYGLEDTSMRFKKGGKVKKMAKGGSTASKRGDGCATKGKTKGRFV